MEDFQDREKIDFLWKKELFPGRLASNGSQGPRWALRPLHLENLGLFAPGNRSLSSGRYAHHSQIGQKTGLPPEGNRLGGESKTFHGTSLPLGKTPTKTPLPFTNAKSATPNFQRILWGCLEGVKPRKGEFRDREYFSTMSLQLPHHRSKRTPRATCRPPFPRKAFNSDRSSLRRSLQLAEISSQPPPRKCRKNPFMGKFSLNPEHLSTEESICGIFCNFLYFLGLRKVKPVRKNGGLPFQTAPHSTGDRGRAKGWIGSPDG